MLNVYFFSCMIILISLLRYLAISLPRYFATSLPRYLQRPRSGKSKGVFYHHRINLHPFLELLEAFEHDL